MIFNISIFGRNLELSEIPLSTSSVESAVAWLERRITDSLKTGRKVKDVDSESLLSPFFLWFLRLRKQEGSLEILLKEASPDLDEGALARPPVSSSLQSPRFRITARCKRSPMRSRYASILTEKCIIIEKRAPLRCLYRCVESFVYDAAFAIRRGRKSAHNYTATITNRSMNT